MDKGFAGKTVLVTGGTSGIGRAIAIGFARAGVNVVIASRRREAKAGEFGEAATQSVFDLLHDEGLPVDFIRTDVTVAQEVEAAADHALDRFGGLDIWINNAGVVAPQKPFLAYDRAEFDQVFDANCRGVWHGMRAAAARMLKAGTQGSIINILSTAALRPHPGQAIYNMSKAAAAQATRCAALELGPSGIRVNAICPTVVRTAISRDFVDTEPFRQWFKSVAALGSPVDVEDVAALALFLASDAAARITGALMPVDSGETLGPPGAQLQFNQ